MRLISVRPSEILFSVFCIVVALTTNAQTPGNVRGCELWLRAEALSKKESIDKLENHSKQNGTLNFNTQISFSDSIVRQVNKLNINKRFTVFAVYKSNSEYSPLFTFKSRKRAIEFDTKKIKSLDRVEYSKGSPEQGIIISYLTSSEAKGKNSLRFFTENLDANNQTEENQTSLLEFIYYPRILNILEKNKIETYLSVKYGVSLLGEKDYISTKGDTLWNFKDNKEFGKRITGIGRDDLTSLNQKQSGNSEKNGIYIHLGDSLYKSNLQNKFELKNETFLIWGDNDKTTLLKQNKKENDEMYKMDRVWKSESRIGSDSLIISLQIDTKEVLLTDKTSDSVSTKSLSHWLLIDESGTSGFDYFNSSYYKGEESKESKISFKTVIWKGNNSKKFTFVKAPDLFFDYQIKTVCESTNNGSLSIAVRGGLSPYIIDVYKNGIPYRTFSTSEKVFDVENLTRGDYKIVISDSKKEKFEKQLAISSFEAIHCQMQPKWYLNGKPEIIINPEAKSNSELTYEWSLNGSTISKDKQLKATQPGDYLLSLKNTEDCTKEFNFTVEDYNKSEGWVLYPNPTKRGEKFTLSFNYLQPTNIAVKITDLNGRVIKAADLGKKENIIYSESLNTSGTYMILITTNNKTETTKLIIE